MRSESSPRLVANATPSDAQHVSEVEADELLEALLAEQVLAGVKLDLAGRVAQVDEGGLAVAAAGDDPPRDPVARLGLRAGDEALVAAPHLGDLLALGERVRERVEARLAQALKLLAPLAEEVRGLGLGRVGALGLAHRAASLSGS